MQLKIDEIRDWIANNMRPDQARFINFERLDSVAKKVSTYGLTVLSTTLLDRAIQDLKLSPLYAKEDESVNKAAEAQRQADAVELTREIGNQLTQLSPQQVAERFHSDPFFARLYTRAAQQWGFKIPAKPAQAASQVPAPVQTLTAREYHSLPAQTIVRKYRSDPLFRQQVDSLISQGLI